MRAHAWVLTITIAGCGDDAQSTVDAAMGTCQADADCGAGFCNAGACGARPMWKDPAKVEGAFNLAGDYMDFPMVRRDGLELFFGSRRSGGVGGYDLWHATRATTADAFGAASVLAAINSSQDEYASTLSSDGLELYFIRSDTVNSSKIMRATRATTASDFGPATEATTLNIKPWQYSVALSGDGLSIVLLAGQPPSVAAFQYNVFAAERTSVTAAFGAPHQLAELGVVSGGPGLAPDGRYILLKQYAEPDQFQVVTRATAAVPFGNASFVGELTGYSMVPAVDGPFVSLDGRSVYYSAWPDGGGTDVWSAVRQ